MLHFNVFYNLFYLMYIEKIIYNNTDEIAKC